MPTKKVYDLIGEPEGEVYLQLLSCLSMFCETLTLVVRGTQANSGCNTFIDELKPFFINSVKTCEWPGTNLFGHEATLHRFRLNRGLTTILVRFSNGLYDWIEPDLPEDPCFYRADGSTWLATIAHERDAYLEITSSEHDRLISHVPAIRALLKPHS
jgi:hypothetical protein